MVNKVVMTMMQSRLEFSRVMILEAHGFDLSKPYEYRDSDITGEAVYYQDSKYKLDIPINYENYG